MSQFDKLIADILRLDQNLRFDDLCKVLHKYGYTMNQPRKGSSHYTFRKDGCLPITIPKHSPIKQAYIKLVAEVILSDLEEE